MNERDPRSRLLAVEPLLPGDVRSLRVSWWSYFDQNTLLRHLLQAPGISFRIKGDNQYAIGSHWRGRPDVGQIVEVVANNNRSELIERMVERFRELGCGAVILSANEASRNLKWYLQQGWQALDEIVIYTRKNSQLNGLPRATLPIESFRSNQIGELLQLEQRAFPFLWWSGEEDFLRYAALPDVKVSVLFLQGQMAGYESTTLRNRQGNLDRLAVHPALQGRGYGSQLLSFALEQLDEAGARTVSLNTQVTNHKSQRLYHKYGFVRTNNVERIYGLWLKKPEELESP